MWGVCLSWIWSFYFICLFFSLAARLKRSANSLKTSIFPLPTPLSGCRSLLEIVFCRTVWGVCLSLIWSFYFICLFFSLAAKLKRSANSLKTSIFPLPTPLSGCRSLLEIVFCRTVWGVCLSWIWSFYFICLFFSLAARLKRSANVASIL